MTPRKVILLLCVIILMMSAIFFLVALIYFLIYDIRFLFNLGINISLINGIIILILYIYILLKYTSIKEFINVQIIKNYLENNLISIGAFNKKSDDSFIYFLPKIFVRKNSIKIVLNDLKIRKQIENYLDSFSTSLPNQFIVDDYYIKENQNELIIKYENIDEIRKEKYNFEEYFSKIKSLDKLQFYFDKKHILSLEDYPHYLISGATGSGKTYLTQELIIQAILKAFKVFVADYKRTYYQFKNMVDYKTDIEDILSQLRSLNEEMMNRYKSSEDQNINPNEIDFEPILIVLEEYIGLQSAMSKEQIKEFENIVKSISVLSRQVNIYLIIVLQSANTENINSSIRHNLTKILLGNANSNILTATFGTGIEIPKQNIQLKKGEGLIQLNRIERLRVPQLTYTIEQIEAIPGRIIAGVPF